jgi:hypothetical protein
MAKYRVETEKGTYEIETADAPAQAATGSSPLDYRTGNSLVDAPLGVVQGALKGLGQSTYNLASAIHKTPIGAVADKIEAATGLSPAPSPEQAQQMFEPRGIGQGTGKFLEQTAEFALPASKVGAAVKGAGLITRAAAQGALGAGVSGIQSNFDPTSTAVGGALGAGGELAGAALKGIKSVAGTKALTGKNVADAFKANPSERLKIITPALDLLKADGVKVGDNAAEMHQAVKEQLAKISDAYNQLDPAIKQKSTPAVDVINQLEKAKQGMLIPGTNKVASGAQSQYKVIESQLQDVADAAAANNGKVSVDQLLKLREWANENTNFGAPDEGIYRKVGDAYRQMVNKLAPQLTDLNNKWHTYAELDKLGKKATGQMRDEAEGIGSKVASALKAHTAGAAAGGALGYQVAGPVGGAVGSIAGGIIGPKLGKAAGQALQNAIDNGAFQALKPSQQLAVKVAAKAGRNSDVLRLLGKSVTFEEATAQ